MGKRMDMEHSLTPLPGNKKLRRLLSSVQCSVGGLEIPAGIAVCAVNTFEVKVIRIHL